MGAGERYAAIKTHDGGAMMPKVSIILPSLNVAGYIRECIEKGVDQTLSDI